MTDPPAKSSITAAGKVLAILETFGPGTRQLSLTTIARRSGLALATTHRIVGELSAWGAVERAEDGTYGIGLRLWELASLAVRGPGLREAALPFMEDLYEATRENVQLAVLDGTELVFIERLAGRHAVRVHTRVGMRFPLTASGAGLALLAYAPLPVAEAVLAAPLRRFTEKTVTDPAVLRTMIAQVRREGASVSVGQVTLDSVSVGAPVFDGDQLVGALSVVVHAEGAHPTALMPLVRTTARALSRTITATHPQPHSTPSAIRRTSVQPIRTSAPSP